MIGNDLALSTAVGLSARFPYLTPAAYYLRKPSDGSERAQKRRLVDGGYVDNTGIETALDLIRILTEIAAHNKLAEKHKFSRLRFVLLSVSTKTVIPDREAGGLSEIMSPIRAMIASWRSRSEITFRNAEQELARVAPGGRLDEARFSRLTMDATYSDLPLSWYLSLATRNNIGNLVAASNACPDGLDAMQTNCVFSTILKELTPR